MTATEKRIMRPLAFCNRSILAWQEHAKSQTRQLVKPQPEEGQEIWHVENKPWWWYGPYRNGAYGLWPIRQPYAVGDILWIREPLIPGEWEGYQGVVLYEADRKPALGLYEIPMWSWRRNKLPPCSLLGGLVATMHELPRYLLNTCRTSATRTRLRKAC